MPRVQNTQIPPSKFSCIHTCTKHLVINLTLTANPNFSTRLALQNHFEICSQDRAPNRWGLN